MESDKTKNESKYLYHFTKSETLIEHILPSYKLKLNTLKNTNDPKERLISMYNTLSNIQHVMQVIEIKNTLRRLLDNQFKICCFSGDYIVNDKEYEGCNLQRMWATYGDNHKGVCLKIDYDKFCLENNVDNKNSVLRNVNYKAELNHDLTMNDKKFDIDYEKVTLKIIEDNLDLIFFLKQIDWKTEREIRFVTTLDNNYCSIKNSVESIIVGLDFNPKYLPAIVNQINPLTDIHRIVYDVYTWQLKAKKIHR